MSDYERQIEVECDRCGMTRPGAPRCLDADEPDVLEDLCEACWHATLDERGDLKLLNYPERRDRETVCFWCDGELSSDYVHKGTDGDQQFAVHLRCYFPMRDYLRRANAEELERVTGEARADRRPGRTR